MNDVVVYLGPTIDPEDARAHLDARFLPPVSQGDVYRAARRRPRAIGIIDGTFGRMPSVWHKEILWAMQQGVHVLGAASMGALRAAELAAFGMEGVGAIYEGYRSGAIEDDDEVAVLHGSGEDGYRPLTEAMVNVRATLDRAVAEGVLDAATSAMLRDAAKALHFTERTWPEIVRRGQQPADAAERFCRWLADGRVDQKRIDAIELLRLLAERVTQPEEPKSVRYRLHRTQFWERARREFMLVDAAGDGASSDREGANDEAGPTGRERALPDAILEELRLTGADYRRRRRASLQAVMALELAESHGIDIDPGFVAARAEALRAHHDGADSSGFEDWLAGQELAESRLHRILGDEVRVQRARRHFAPAVPARILDELRREGGYASLRDRARAKQSALTARGLGNPTLNDAGLDEPAIWSWFFAGLGEPLPEDLTAWARQHDFDGLAALRRAVLREYCYQQLCAPER